MIEGGLDGWMAVDGQIDRDGFVLYLPGSWAGDEAGVSHLPGPQQMSPQGSCVPQVMGGGCSCSGGCRSINGSLGGSDFFPVAILQPLGQAGWMSHLLSQVFSVTAPFYFRNR